VIEGEGEAPAEPLFANSGSARPPNKNPRLAAGVFLRALQSGDLRAISGRSHAGGHSQQASPAFGSAACAAALVARLFVILATTHFLLDSRVFDQFAEPLHSVRNRFMLAQTQLDHETLLVTQNVGNGGAALESPLRRQFSAAMADADERW
jgi:hypothetical protein